MGDWIEKSAKQREQRREVVRNFAFVRMMSLASKK